MPEFLRFFAGAAAIAAAIYWLATTSVLSGWMLFVLVLAVIFAVSAWARRFEHLLQRIFTWMAVGAIAIGSLVFFFGEAVLGAAATSWGLGLFGGGVVVGLLIVKRGSAPRLSGSGRDTFVPASDGRRSSGRNAPVGKRGGTRPASSAPVRRVCTPCSGTGQVFQTVTRSCSSCGGSGHLSANTRCWSCLGSGTSQSSEPATCRACYGSGSGY